MRFLSALGFLLIGQLVFAQDSGNPDSPSSIEQKLRPQDAPQIQALLETGEHLHLGEVLKALSYTDLIGFEGGEVEEALFAAGTDGRSAVVVNSANYRLQQQGVKLTDFSSSLDRPLFEALVEARLQLEMTGLMKTPVGEFIRSRAGQTMKSLPPDLQIQGFLSALVHFAGDLLTVPNQIEGMRLRKIASGKGTQGLCNSIAKAEIVTEKNLSLFYMWNKLMAAPHFGSVVNPESGEVGFTRDFLTEADKREFIQLMFENAWTGNARADFGPLVCGVQP